MSGARDRDDTPQHAAVTEAVTSFVRAHGKARGLFLAAQAIGIGERAARHAYEGTPFAADEERAARADAARLALLREQIARLHAEAEQLERRGANEEVLETARAALDSNRRVLRAAGGHLLSTGEA